MRKLEVIGMGDDGVHVVCRDPENQDQFSIPANEKLRAAARGDLARFGQIEIEVSGSMRPRDIQIRIRAGASVADLVAETGWPEHKVDSYAYPVLLERSRFAQLAQQAHPVIESGPAVQTLAEVVAMAFKSRGHDLSTSNWDAWKHEDGYWVAQLQWTTGRSDNSAHWRFQPDGHGGTVAPLDDAATDLIDPDFGRARALTSVPGLLEPTVAPDQPQLEGLDVLVPTTPRNPDVATLLAGGNTGAAKAKPKHPEMPSWEQVLLGVRSR